MVQPFEDSALWQKIVCLLVCWCDRWVFVCLTCMLCLFVYLICILF